MFGFVVSVVLCGDYALPHVNCKYGGPWLCGVFGFVGFFAVWLVGCWFVFFCLVVVVSGFCVYNFFFGFVCVVVFLVWFVCWVAGWLYKLPQPVGNLATEEVTVPEP